MDEFQDFSGKNYKRNIDHPDLNLNIENWYVDWPNFLTMSKVFVLRFNAASSGEPGVVDKLRWATLGYHHDWDTKVYSEDNKGEFPADLATLSAGIVKALGGDEQYRAEAAIVNYYPVNSSLSGTLWVTDVCIFDPLAFRTH